MKADPTHANVSPTASHYWYRKRREVARLCRRHVRLRQGAQIVDLGGGRGNDIPLLSGLFPDVSILSLDGSQADVDTFNRVHADRPRVRAEFADLRVASSVEPSSVDLVYTSEVLEHMPDPGVLIREAFRIARPGGWFIATTPNEPNVWQKSWWLRRDIGQAVPVRAELELHGHISLNTVRGWDELIAAVGFQYVDSGRGALMYGARPWLDSEPALAAYFVGEALLDLLPRSFTRRIAGQYIGLHRKPLVVA